MRGILQAARTRATLSPSRTGPRRPGGTSMNAALLEKIFGRDQRWHGPCTVILDAEAGVTALGVDSIVGGGAKFYDPRMVSGRVSADSVCLLDDLSAVLLVQNQKVRQNTGEESLRQTLTI